MSEQTLKQLAKELIKKKKAVTNTLQFNLKIERKREYDNFLKQNNITVRYNEPFCFYSQNEKEIFVIGNRYSSKKVNLDYKEIGKFLRIVETDEIINFK